MTLVLVGPMGAGKSTVAALLAEACGARPPATPTPTSRRPTGRSISDIFVESGEAHFRALEREAVAKALADSRRRAVPRRRRGARRGHPAAADRLRAHGGVPAGRAWPRRSSGSGWARRGRCCSATSDRGSRPCSTSARPSTSPSRTSWSTPTSGRPRTSPTRSGRRWHERHRPAGARRLAVRRRGRSRPRPSPARDARPSRRAGGRDLPRAARGLRRRAARRPRRRSR